MRYSGTLDTEDRSAGRAATGVNRQAPRFSKRCGTIAGRHCHPSIAPHTQQPIPWPARSTYVARGEETPWRPGMRLGGMHDTVSHMSRMSESTRLSKTARSEGSEDFDSYPVVGNHGHEVIAEPARNLPAARNRRWGSPRHRGLHLLCIKHPYFFLPFFTVKKAYANMMLPVPVVRGWMSFSSSPPQSE